MSRAAGPGEGRTAVIGRELSAPLDVSELANWEPANSRDIRVRRLNGGPLHRLDEGLAMASPLLDHGDAAPLVAPSGTDERLRHGYGTNRGGREPP